MIRKYWWLVVFAVFVFLFDTLLMQWIELLATEKYQTEIGRAHV